MTIGELFIILCVLSVILCVLELVFLHIFSNAIEKGKFIISIISLLVIGLIVVIVYIAFFKSGVVDANMELLRQMLCYFIS